MTLLQHLEAAGEGSRELDAELARLFGGQAVARFGDWDCRETGEGIWYRLPSYTTSLDAALALAERVLPGLAWHVGQNVHHRHWIAYATALDAGGLPVEPTHGNASTPALALCAAILRARSAGEGGA